MDSYEDTSGIHELVDSESCFKNSYLLNERETESKTSSISALKQDFFYNSNQINLISKNEWQPFSTSAHMNSDKHDDKKQFLTGFIFPLNRVCSSSENKFSNKNHEIHHKTKSPFVPIDETPNCVTNANNIQIAQEIKNNINNCEKSIDFVPHHDVDIQNRSTLKRNGTHNYSAEIRSNENIIQPEHSKSPTVFKLDYSYGENANDDSTLSFTLNEFTCVLSDSQSIEKTKLTLCDENIRNKNGTESVTKYISDQKPICNTESHSKIQELTKEKQTTEDKDKKMSISLESCCLNTVKHVEAALTVIENTQTYIQSIEKSIEQLRNSMKQLNVIKYDLANSIQNSNKCSCECLKSKILNIPNNLNFMNGGVLDKKFQAKNCNSSKGLGTEDSKHSLENVKFSDDSGQFQSELKGEELSIDDSNCHVLSSSESYYNTPDVTVQESASGCNTFLAKNVTFKIPHRTPVSSRRRTKVYSNYKCNYSMCVKTPESSMKRKKQMNRSLVLTPRTMSNRLNTQIGNLFKS